MRNKLEELNQLLKEYEHELDNAYVEYAKKIDIVSSQEMKVINRFVDKIINLKKAIKEEEETHNYDKES